MVMINVLEEIQIIVTIKSSRGKPPKKDKNKVLSGGIINKL